MRVVKPDRSLMRSCETYVIGSMPLVVTGDVFAEKAELEEAYGKCIAQTRATEAWDRAH